MNNLRILMYYKSYEVNKWNDENTCARLQLHDDTFAILPRIQVYDVKVLTWPHVIETGAEEGIALDDFDSITIITQHTGQSRLGQLLPLFLCKHSMVLIPESEKKVYHNILPS